ncbi:MAG: hypothetical protein GXP35_09955 [Actinobacteria bacterium]|nr:hypothetical protein [Actinomycetota bacterium]
MVGLDIGTTSVKAVVVDGQGAIIASASSKPLSFRAPKPGWAVQSTSEVKEAVVECLSRLTKNMPKNAQVLAVCAAVQSGSLVVVDESGIAAADMTTWMDTRTSSIVESWVADGTAAAVRENSGWSVQPGLGLPQVVWLKVNEPGLHERSRFGSADDFVMSLLVGSWITNPSNAAGMQLLDGTTGRWSEDLCALAGVAPERLSELRDCGAMAGELTSDMAAATGLVESLPVVVGGHDQTCTALGLGVDRPGEALLAAGTAWVVTTVIDEADTASVPDEMNVSFHVVEGLRTSSRYLGGLGASMEWWLVEAGFVGDTDRYALLDETLRRTTLSLDSPYFLGPGGEDATAGGSHPGAGTFSPTGASSDRGKFALAIMEFAAFEVRTALRSMPRDHRPTALTLVGGASQAAGWSQLIASACAIRIEVVRPGSWPAVGAAVLAAQQSGLMAEGSNGGSRAIRSHARPIPD